MNATVFLPFTNYIMFLLSLLALSFILIFLGHGPLRIVGYIMFGISILAIVYITFIWITLSHFSVPYNNTATFLKIVHNNLIAKGMKL